LGGHLWPGDHGGQAHDADHACRHRRCPKCHHHHTEVWLAARRPERLPVPSLHVVLTLPPEVHDLVRRPQQDVSDTVRRAAAHALITLAMDPHDVGGLIGVWCILHTWTRPRTDHPHVHCLVPAGGVSADRTEWRPARPSSLVPVHALATRFRGLVLALVRQERPDLSIPQAVWPTGWVVDGKPAVHGTAKVLNDLGRDVHRSALTNSRMLALEDGAVCCRSQDAQDQRWKTMTLPAHEFIRRFLQHVLPQGFHKVRYYGLWSPVHRPLLHQLQLWLAGPVPALPPTSPPPESPSTASWAPLLRAGQTCPSCEQGLLVVIRSLPRPPRGPP
jgi:Putative transposase/Transposase zinc-binding domain